ncbi:MAG: cyclodeaminase/cyclohydrolase family protein [Candidatus Omnitrophota bacterium]
MYIQKTIKEYLGDLAAKLPAPGGGSASALSGAAGIALLEMVCNFTVGNKKYKESEEDIARHLVSLRALREAFSALIDEDAEVYSRISEAFKTKDEKNIDKALKDGYYISVKICGLSKNGLRIALDLSDKGNANLITDVGCGAASLKAAFDSGVFNAEINLKGIKDRGFVSGETKELKASREEMDGLYAKSVDRVNERIRQ